MDSSRTGETDQVTDQEIKLPEESKTSCFKMIRQEVQ